MASAEPPVIPGPIRAYLLQLELELERADPALRHDALLDAEGHLRAAVRAGVDAERAIAEYGRPAEIATAYLAAEGASAASGRQVSASAWRGEPGTALARTGSGSHRSSVPGGAEAAPAVPAPWRVRDIPVLGIWADARAWGALVYFGAVGFALSIAYFVWAIVIGSLSIGLATVIVGVPLFIFLLGSARALCLFEGKVVEVFLGVRMPRRVQPVEGADTVGFWQRIWCWLKDVRSWLSLGFLLGNFPVAVVLFAVTVTVAAASAVLIGVPLLEVLGIHALHLDLDDADDVTVSYLGRELTPDADGVVRLPPSLIVLSFAVGVAVATAGLWLMRGLGWVYGNVVQAIQVARPRATVPPRG